MSCNSPIPLDFIGSVLQGPPGEIRNNNALLIFSSFAEGINEAKTLPNYQKVLIEEDETRLGYSVLCEVQSGQLEFKEFVYGSLAKESLPIIYATGSEDIQAKLITASNSSYRVRPAEYAGDFDLVISGKNAQSTGVSGALTIDMTGVRFTGTGKIILDGCKRPEIIGLDAPNFSICYRGVWWATLRKVRYRKQIFGDALGSNFQSNYWCDWYNCQLQTIEIGPFATYSNKMDWYSCSMRGNIGQGFTQTADYAFEFNGNSNAQAWAFHGGDVSYHVLDIYKVGEENISGDIELVFHDTYFDTKFPKRLDRNRSRVITKTAHPANELPTNSTLAAVSRGSQDAQRQDRGASWPSFSGHNFIPNGSLSIGMPTYAGANLPIGSTGGAVVTELSGVGPNGRALKLTQAGNTGTVRFRSVPLPFRGKYSCGVILRNGVPGSYRLRAAFNNLYEVIDLVDTEWNYFPLTAGATIDAGTAVDIQLLSDNGTPFNIDVAGAFIVLGEGGMPIGVPQQLRQVIGQSSTFFNPPSLANGESVSTTISIPGVVFGDIITPSFSADLLGLTLTANVSSPGNVTVTFSNMTGFNRDVASGAIRVLVTKIPGL